jgi:TQO small subunit DoxD
VNRYGRRRTDALFERMALGLALARIAAGGIWLLNLGWKLPPDYGRHDARGLHYWLEVARAHAVTSPLRAFVRDVVLPHYTVFGTLVFCVEAVAGVLLLTGFSTAIGATLGTAQAIAIGLLVANAPGEWRLAYVMMAFLNALPLIAPADLRLSLDARLGRVTVF